MNCPFCTQDELIFNTKNNTLDFECQVHGKFKITQEAHYNYKNFNQYKQIKINEYISNNDVDVITVNVFDNILRMLPNSR